MKIDISQFRRDSSFYGELTTKLNALCITYRKEF